MAAEKKGKMNKSYYINTWIVDMVSEEADRYDGPGVVVSAAINAFCSATDEQKRRMLKEFRQAEIDHAYADADDIVSAAEADAAKMKRKAGRRPRKRA